MSMAARDTDRAWLDAEYNVRAGIHYCQEIFDRWAHSSEALRNRPEVITTGDIPYGEHPLQRFDVYQPAEATAAVPALVFIHGGYWHSLDKTMFGFLAAPYLAAGVAFVAINYRLAPEVGMDDIVADTRAALLAIHSTAHAHNVDPHRIYLAGHSAGGHLTAMMLATDWTHHGVPADLLHAGCAISGLYDLEPIRRCYLNDVLGMDTPTSLRNSPNRLVQPNPTPLLLTVGGDESAEFHRQQSEFAATRSAQQAPYTVVHQAVGHHFDAVEQLGKPSDLSDALLKQITRGMSQS